MELKNDEQKGGEFEEHLLLLGSSLFFCRSGWKRNGPCSMLLNRIEYTDVAAATIRKDLVVEYQKDKKTEEKKKIRSFFLYFL